MINSKGRTRLKRATDTELLGITEIKRLARRGGRRIKAANQSLNLSGSIEGFKVELEVRNVTNGRNGLVVTKLINLRGRDINGPTRTLNSVDDESMHIMDNVAGLNCHGGYSLRIDLC